MSFLDFFISRTIFFMIFPFIPFFIGWAFALLTSNILSSRQVKILAGALTVTLILFFAPHTLKKYDIIGVKGDYHYYNSTYTFDNLWSSFEDSPKISTIMTNDPNYRIMSASDIELFEYTLWPRKLFEILIVLCLIYFGYCYKYLEIQNDKISTKKTIIQNLEIDTQEKDKLLNELPSTLEIEVKYSCGAVAALIMALSIIFTVLFYFFHI